MPKKAMVVTVGSPMESLGALKLANWLRREGYTVTTGTDVAGIAEFPDLFAFSVVFSWRLPALIEMVKSVSIFADVWIGGPAVTFHPANAALVARETGIAPRGRHRRAFRAGARRLPHGLLLAGVPGLHASLRPMPCP